MAYEGWERGRRYGDEESRYRDDYDRGRRYRGEGYAYGSEPGYPAESERGRRDWGRRDRDDRGFFERAGDEVRSWFGDDEAQRRRERDEREHGSSESGWGERWREPRRGGSWEREPIDRDWARQWGYVDRSERGPSRSEWSRPERSTYEGTWRGVYGPTYGSGSGWGSQGSSEEYRDEPTRSSGWRERESSLSSGPYAGRGPRGYQRGDERIKEEVCERMSRHGQLDASDIEVVVTNCEVTLQGNVNDRHAKRLAEDLAESVWGVRQVHNQLRTPQSGFGGSGQGGSGQSPEQPRRVA